MRLDALLPNTMKPPADIAALDIRGIAADSRDISTGYLFAALAGEREHGQKFIPQAIANGAVVVLGDMNFPDKLPDNIAVPLIKHENPRRALAHLASRFFAYHPHHLACVTGTNGKTSVAHFLQQFWAACGHNAAAIGTLNILPQDTDIGAHHTPHTTSEPVALHAMLRDLYAHDITHLALEASSHGLAQYRLDGIRPQVAGFTNLSHDHLDYHATQDDYFAAKARLFVEVLADDGIGVIHVGSAAGRAMADVARRANRRVMEVGAEGATLYMNATTHTAQGMEAQLHYNGQTHNVHVPLVGAFQLANIEVALGMVLAQTDAENDITTLLTACTNLQGAQGRMQFIGTTANEAAAYIDYAHTPAALESALAALRQHLPHHARLHIVFGCGGDRDASKRAAMGAIAARLADNVIITDDNPRHEEAANIRAAIRNGAGKDAKVQDIANRADAITTALTTAQAQDIVLIAGKGHESGQIIGEQTHPFDDAAIVRAFITGARHA